MPDLVTTELQPPKPMDRVVSLLRTGPRALVWRFVDQASRKVTGVPLWHLSRLRPFLYLGGQHAPRGWEAMQGEGITAVINMREDYHSDADKGIGGERHLHLATRDNTPISIENMHRAADFIQSEQGRGGKVYVHCALGVGRAAIATATYLIKYEGMTADEALAEIRTVRPFVHPTHAQMRYLTSFANSVHGINIS